MRRETLIAIWGGGLFLALVIYLVGADQFLEAVANALNALDYLFRSLLFDFGAHIFRIVRALTIALYVVFVVLAVLAASRGRGGVGALIVVTIVYSLLIWRPYNDYPVPVGRWIIAFVLVLIAAITMTQRLMRQPREGRWPPWPPFQQPPGPPGAWRDGPPGAAPPEPPRAPPPRPPA